MACCGDAAAGRLTISQKDIDEGLVMQVEYLGGRTVQVQALVTGKTYTFSGLSRIGLVDPRDGPAVLRNPNFRLKGLTRTKNQGDQ